MGLVVEIILVAKEPWSAYPSLDRKGAKLVLRLGCCRAPQKSRYCCVGLSQYMTADIEDLPDTCFAAIRHQLGHRG
jgi:hypothetical protein